MSAVVLAGGQSTRLGRSKLWETLAHQNLVERAVGRLVALDMDIIVVTAPGVSLPPVQSERPAKIISDLCPGSGSLGGIYTGLAASTSFHSPVVACDMPFLNVALLRHMLALAPGYDVIIPCLGGKLEPLHAVYSQGCLRPIQGLLRERNLKIIDFFPQVKVRYLQEEEIGPFDPLGQSFFNINTEADLAQARALIEKELMDVP